MIFLSQKKTYLIIFLLLFIPCADYVYFETSSSSPYQIRRIEELNKTPSGNVEAKVMCFYRRRDLPTPLVQLADKHQSEYQFSLLCLNWVNQLVCCFRRKFHKNTLLKFLKLISIFLQAWKVKFKLNKLQIFL